MGRRWLSALITKLRQVAWDIWQHRNNMLHKKDNNILYAQQIQEIKDQFILGKPGLTHDAKRLLTRGLRATLALSPALRQVSYYVLHSLAYGLQEDRENAKADIHGSDRLWLDG